jgi:hypothetical protein
MNIFFRLWPVFAVLASNTLIAAFLTEFTFLSGANALWKVPVRYLRISLNLTLPLFLLPIFCLMVQRLINRREKGLMGTQDRNLNISQGKTWFLRPFQGIGLSLLLAAKLLAVLQGYSGTPLVSSIVLPPGQFLLGRFFAVLSIGILVSLLLSFVWALDDLGIRYRNGRTGEVRMVGKYLGAVLPIVFGFYGFINILKDVPFLQAVYYVFQMAVVLYPPFCTLTVCHTIYVRRYGAFLLKSLRVAAVPSNFVL